MSDSTSARPLDESDAATLLFSLETLSRKTKELHDSLPISAVKENLWLHIGCILSAAAKIEADSQIENRFSQDELRVMYIAVCELRETVLSVLDARSSSEETRQKAFSHLKELNGLLRRLKGEMERNGFTIDDQLTAAYS